MRCIAIALLLTVCITTTPGFCAELNGWIKGDTCWVVKTPSVKAKIIGMIKKKAAVTVEDAQEGWLKIVFAPVRDPQTGKWIECTGCFIQKSNFTTTLPNKW
jgi:uncharacterized protein YgiM (DUF1202 family)